MYAEIVEKREVMQNFDFWQLVTLKTKKLNLKNLPDKVEVTFAEYSPERNIPQNSKYWSIVGDIARETDQSKTCVHNQLLNDYGEMCMENGEPVVVVMRDGYNYLEDPTLHLAPTGKKTEINGEKFHIYYKLLDSSQMSKKQFSRLIDGAEYERSCLGS